MGRVEKKYGINNPNSAHIFSLKKKNLPTIRKAFKSIVENNLDVPIRYIVAYQEQVKYQGFCNTCSYEETVVDVYFKSSEGKMCLITYTETLSELVSKLIAHSK